jgi:hypothetical protein
MVPNTNLGAEVFAHHPQLGDVTGDLGFQVSDWEVGTTPARAGPVEAIAPEDVNVHLTGVFDPGLKNMSCAS